MLPSLLWTRRQCRQHVFSLTLCLWLLLFYWQTPRVFADPGANTPSSPPTIQVGQSLTHTYLKVNHRLFLELPGVHLDHPQLSPDGRAVAVTVIPTGSETAALARVYLFDSASGQLMTTLPGYTPEWAADSTTLMLRTATTRFSYNLRTGQQVRTATIDSAQADPGPVHAANHHGLLAPPNYPQTIRVLHHANNACRNEPAGQIDVIAFEEYVARVVPAEMPAFWQFDALAAQAVAARTYAWEQILVGRPNYDVTDWANFQMMCDDRYPIPDEAVAQTAGQYLSEMGDSAAWPISAMYSAENGHPTLTNPNVTYLQAVPDLLALGKVRNGHGYGLSQWGAQRRALAGHTYQQILGHYYTNINLQNALDPSQPLGGLREPTPGDAITANAVHWQALTSSAAPDLALKINGVGFTDTVTLSGPEGIWRAPFTLTENTTLTTELWVDGARQDQVVLPVDTTPPPPPSLTLPAVVNSPTFSITVQAETGALVGLSQAWQWEGETLSHTANSGVAQPDAKAANGATWAARAGVDQPGAWYGPYTTALPPDQDYRAIFWLRAHPIALAAGQAPMPLARLDVTDHGGDDQLGLRDVWASDFVTTDGYQPIAVDFHLFATAQGVEFRVAWPGKVDLALDQVQVWRLSNQAGQPLKWDAAGSTGIQTIAAAAFDPAGNISQPVSRTVQIVDNQPPAFGDIHAPTTWISTTHVAVSTSVIDTFSGLDVQRGALLVGQQVLSATLSLPQSPQLQQTLSATVTQLAQGQYTARFRAADRAGNVAQSSGFPLWIDTTAPTVTATVNLTTTDPWLLTPVTLTLAAQDQLSGIRQINYTANDPAIIATPNVYTRPILWDKPGIQLLRYWATDKAGNASAQQIMTITLDLTAPTLSIVAIPISPNKVQLQWHAEDDASGVANIEVQSQQAGGAWQAHPASPFRQSNGNVSFAVEEGNVLPVRLRATDYAGHLSDWLEIQLFPASAWIYLPWIAR